MWKREYDPKQIGSGNDFLARYVNNFNELESFFGFDYRQYIDLVAVSHRLKNRTWKARYQKGLTADLLESYLERFPHHRAVAKNVKKLRDQPNCVCVITGQQSGLGGGPLYVLYKALSAIRLARAVEISSDIPCIPIFWNASDDSDIEEVNRLRSVDGHGLLKKFRFNIPSGKAHVRDIPLPSADDKQWQKAIELLPDGPYRDRAEILLLDAAGRDLGTAFTSLLLELFGSQGLVVIEPWALTAHPAWKAIHQAEINSHEQHQAILQKTADKLHAAGLNPGVAIRNQLNIFRTDDGKRQTIRVEGRKLIVDGQNSPTSKTALSKELRDSPGRFTPNVLLRPVVQNAIFPTAAYIGGPAEIAYHSLLKSLHRKLKVFFPAIVPRFSATLVDSTDTSGFDNAVRFQSKLKWKQSEAEVSLSQTKKQLDSAFASLERNISQIPAGAKEVQNLKSRILRSVSDTMQPVRHQPLSLVKDGDSHKLLLGKYFPAGAPQERIVSLISAYAQYGPKIVNLLDSHRSPFDFKHVAVEAIFA